MQEIIKWVFHSEAGIVTLLLGICSIVVVWFVFWVRGDDKKHKERLKRKQLGLERPDYLKKKYWD